MVTEVHPILQKLYNRVSEEDLIFIKSHEWLYHSNSFNWLANDNIYYFKCIVCDSYINLTKESSIYDSNIVREIGIDIIYLSCMEPIIEDIIT